VVGKVTEDLASQWPYISGLFVYGLSGLVRKRHGCFYFLRHACETGVILQVVIGNILETRKTEVVVVRDTGEKWIRIENPATEEIEKLIVEELILCHTAHMSSL